MTDAELVTLIVVESGADFPTWAAQINRTASTNLIETEVSGETEAEFKARVLGRLGRLRDRNIRLASAAYVAAPASRKTELREQISSSILEQMVPNAEFALAGGYLLPSGAPQSGHAQLLELWQRLSERGSSQLIALRFNESPESAHGTSYGAGSHGASSHSHNPGSHSDRSARAPLHGDWR